MPPGPPPVRQQIVMIVFLLVGLGSMLVLREQCGAGIGALVGALDLPVDGGRPRDAEPAR